MINAKSNGLKFFSGPASFARHPCRSWFGPDARSVVRIFPSGKFRNLVDAEIADYVDKRDFLARLDRYAHARAIFHEGACSDTMESDGRYMMDNNFAYSLSLLEHANTHRIPFIYASSAAVYGGSQRFVEEREFEKPLNVYGYSKFLFDQIVRRRLPGSATQVVGLRYFNVYGPREAHKGRMASVAFLRERTETQGDIPVIVAGDLNATPDSRVLAEAAAFLADTCPGDAESAWTYPADTPTKRIDYILTNDHPGLRCVAFRVIPEAVASDHRPVLAVFEIRPAPAHPR